MSPSFSREGIRVGPGATAWATEDVLVDGEQLTVTLEDGTKHELRFHTLILYGNPNRTLEPPYAFAYIPLPDDPARLREFLLGVCEARGITL